MSNFKDKKTDYKQYVVDSQLRYFKPHATNIEKSFAEEIAFSLNRRLLNLSVLNFSMIKKVQIYLNPFVQFLNTIQLELKLVF